MLGESRLRFQPAGQLAALDPAAQQVGQLLPQRPRVVLIQPVVVLRHLAPVQRQHGGQALTEAGLLVRNGSAPPNTSTPSVPPEFFPASVSFAAVVH
jgi:hypothetical protein